MPRDASDTAPLLGATAQGRVLFPFNIADCAGLAAHDPQPGGLLLAVQRRWTVAQLIAALDRVLATTTAAAWPGQERWLQPWCA